MEEREKVIEIEIERLRDFREHPFQVKDDKDMHQLKESMLQKNLVIANCQSSFAYWTMMKQWWRW